MPPAPPGRSAAQTREHLLDVLGPLVADAGFDLEDVTVTPAGRRSLVRVTVDSDSGIDLDAVAAISRVISDALDNDSPGAPGFAGPFVLEVSSPGVDRPLTEHRHWRRAVGRLVTVTVGEKPLTGRVMATSGAGVRLSVDGTDRELAWSELGRGKVQVEFARANAAEAADDAHTDDDSAGFTDDYSDAEEE
jgi:ribosome maturation factor RimP